MRDLLHAEGQLSRRCQRWRRPRVRPAAALFEQHLAETEEQVERLNEGSQAARRASAAKPCKGMMGLSKKARKSWPRTERRGKRADLALIGAAQKVEHYEICRLHDGPQPRAAAQDAEMWFSSSMSLAEEENADQLLNQVARPLMSAARMPALY